jgi:hypothetical protein
MDELAQLRHLYSNLLNGGVRDTASAKSIATGLLGPVIESLERASEARAAPHPAWCSCGACNPEDAEASATGAEPSGWSNAQLDSMLTDALKERDHCEDMADQLAEQIAAITGQEIGEHSSGNDPWRNAMLAADDFIADQLRKLLLATPTSSPVQAEGPSEDEMVHAAYGVYGYQKGTGKAIAFNDGARWMREALAAAPVHEGLTAEFELWQINGEEDMFLAGTEGPRAQAFSEIMGYYRQYSQDGRVKVFEVSRKEIAP